MSALPQAGQSHLADDLIDVEETGRGEEAPATLGLVELLLKRPAQIDRLILDPGRQREVFPRLLLITLVSYLVYGGLLALLIDLAPNEDPRSEILRGPVSFWTTNGAWSLPIAYSAGVVLTACVCLPSFYFYSLLAGVRLSWLQITAVVGKGMAANSVLLLGVAPVYFIGALGAIIFHGEGDVVPLLLTLGLALPFLTGLWGLRAIFQGVMNLVEHLPGEWQCRRRCFLRRLVLSWAAVYAVVLPVMIYRLWEQMAGL